jgi:ABC-type transport system involved in cytochrome c biogenesis permease component
MLTFWGALTARRSDSEFDKFLYLLLNLGFVGLSALLGRRVFAVCGALGVALYLGHLSARIFKDSLLFPLALTLIGLGVMACGIVWQRHEARIQATLRQRLPPALQGWLP